MDYLVPATLLCSVIRVKKQIGRFSARDRLDREELHGRAVR